MAWPTTKAGTTNVDAGTDLVKNARADIKQNIDNVNSIIDEFNISSPSDGDLLQYSSSSGVWEQVSSSSIQNVNLALVSFTDADQLVSSNTYRKSLSETFDPNNIVAVDNTYQLTIGAGNYIIEATILSDDSEATIRVHDETNDIQLGSIGGGEIGTTGDNLFTARFGFTAATQINISLRQDDPDTADRDQGGNFTLTKF